MSDSLNSKMYFTKMRTRTFSMLYYYMDLILFISYLYHESVQSNRFTCMKIQKKIECKYKAVNMLRWQKFHRSVAYNNKQPTTYTTLQGSEFNSRLFGQYEVRYPFKISFCRPDRKIFYRDCYYFFSSLPLIKANNHIYIVIVE